MHESNINGKLLDGTGQFGMQALFGYHLGNFACFSSNLLVSFGIKDDVGFGEAVTNVKYPISTLKSGCSSMLFKQ